MKHKSDRYSRRAGTVRVLTTYPTNDASRRLRIEPLVREFCSRGHTVTVNEIFTNRAYDWKNAGAMRRACAACAVALGLLRRLILIIIMPSVDVLVIHREAFPFYTPLFERLAARRAEIAVLDVDDAIYYEVTHGRDWRRFFRKPGNARAYPRLFDIILCGNYQLMEAFGVGTAQVIYAPTCPERSVHRITHERNNALYDAVWIGSQSTLPSLIGQLPAIREALHRTASRLLVVGGRNVFTLQTDEFIEVALWSRDRELEALQNSRIGIMPLPDTEWERGKSGYKAIMYMCAGLVAVVSPVGFNQVLAEKYGAVSCCDGEWTEVLEAVLSDDEPVRPDRLAFVRSTFDPKNVAAYSYHAIMQQFASKNGCF